ncbi:hypothetical protein BAUCODRAFT_36741 [Baudoinia panamericana UAMH 10762]|uniref:Telomeric single stranded DNA binding POT1/Cdc13 domain-containing protein n=1 Tax=Baudoinia panamericana (strain UAMH 10762) TaxID=717646 RepID=M2N5F3_BAUPA|nr:uncharacterized protein BAUCODRAFT_36741 [Baudoinia panamericana UAMH 10762]EMC94274.1 hypothetical protein BAUCODRAFT_36741 [Baudoinia panamericana UAMH 10762]
METVPIQSLDPGNGLPTGAAIRAVVTLSWPYSSSTRQCALLLADPDFRLRHNKGQIRVRFRGPSAEAVAKAHAGIGDEVVLSLDGASWVRDVGAPKTPGRSVGGELVFERRLQFKVQSEDRKDDIDVDAPASPPTPPQIEKNQALHSSTPPSTRTQGLRSSFDGTFDSIPIYSSPAFVKRSRLSGGSFLDPAFDPFSDDALELQQPNKKQRLSFGHVAQWRYTERSPSPVKPTSSPHTVDQVGHSASLVESHAHTVAFQDATDTDGLADENSVSLNGASETTSMLGPLQPQPVPAPATSAVAPVTSDNPLYGDIEVSSEGQQPVMCNHNGVPVSNEAPDNNVQVPLLPSVGHALDNVDAVMSDQADSDTKVLQAGLQPPMAEEAGHQESESLPHQNTVSARTNVDHDDPGHEASANAASTTPVRSHPLVNLQGTGSAESNRFGALEQPPALEGVLSPQPHTPRKSVSFDFRLDRTAETSARVTPQSERDTIMAKTYKSLFGFGSTPSPSPETPVNDSPIRVAVTETASSLPDAELATIIMFHHDNEALAETALSPGVPSPELRVVDSQDLDNSNKSPENAAPVSHMNEIDDGVLHTVAPVAAVEDVASPLPAERAEDPPLDNDRAEADLNVPTNEGPIIATESEADKVQLTDVSMTESKSLEPDMDDEGDDHLGRGLLVPQDDAHGKIAVEESLVGDESADAELHAGPVDQPALLSFVSTTGNNNLIDHARENDIPIAMPDHVLDEGQSQGLSPPSFDNAGVEEAQKYRMEDAGFQHNVDDSYQSSIPDAQHSATNVGLGDSTAAEPSPPLGTTESGQVTDGSPAEDSQLRLLAHTSPSLRAGDAPEIAMADSTMFDVPTMFDGMTDADPSNIVHEQQANTTGTLEQPVSVDAGEALEVAPAAQTKVCLDAPSLYDESPSDLGPIERIRKASKRSEDLMEDIDIHSQEATHDVAVPQPVNYPSLPRSPFDSQEVFELEETVPIKHERIARETLPLTPQLTQTESDIPPVTAVAEEPTSMKRSPEEPLDPGVLHTESETPLAATAARQTTPPQRSTEQPLNLETAHSTVKDSGVDSTRDATLVGDEEQAHGTMDTAVSTAKFSEAEKGTIGPPQGLGLLLGTPKTPTRKSLKSRISHVPDVISAWFSPKRSSGITKDTPAQGPKAATEVRLVDTNHHADGASAVPTLSQSPSNGVLTSVGYFTPLSQLERRLNPSNQAAVGTANTVDVLAAVADSTKPPERSKNGPRDYFTVFRVSDSSISANATFEVQVFRPWKAVLPVAEVGDVILLRSFAVKSRKRQPYLLSTDASAWCVWRCGSPHGDEHLDDDEKEREKPIWARKHVNGTGTGMPLQMREEVKGPPVELGEEERQHAKVLRDWWVAHGGGNNSQDNDSNAATKSTTNPRLEADL